MAPGHRDGDGQSLLRMHVYLAGACPDHTPEAAEQAGWEPECLGSPPTNWQKSSPEDNVWVSWYK